MMNVAINCMKGGILLHAQTQTQTRQNHYRHDEGSLWGGRIIQTTTPSTFGEGESTWYDTRKGNRGNAKGTEMKGNNKEMGKWK